MKAKRLGSSGLTAAPVGLGTMGCGGAYGQVNEAQALTAFRFGIDNGMNLIDTASFYGDETGEHIVGRAIAGRRDQVILASTIGLRPAPEGGSPDGSPAFLRSQLDNSLKRLGVDHVDLCYLARTDPSVPLEESFGALADLVTAGKTRSIGLCGVSAGTVRRAAAVHPVAAVQAEYSLWERHVEAEILPVLRELGIALVACQPLGSGFLTGRLTVDRLPSWDVRRKDPRLQDENVIRNLRLLTPIQELADRTGWTAAQVALAWLLAQGEDVVAIPGSTSAAHMAENLDAVNVTLSLANASELAAALPDTAGAAGHSRRSRTQPTLPPQADES
jgi:aryl-alcohol dehydrogenase-like predicted oxidoreductase